MAVEIERKFLVEPSDWQALSFDSKRMKQGYLASDSATTVRVRVAGEQAWLTVKGLTSQVSRTEFEYDIPVNDALQMLQEMCSDQLIEKTRYFIKHQDHIWEVDVFEGRNQGLVVAEIELASENESFAKPSWLSTEVSDDPRYFNINLMKHPFELWTA